MNKNKLEKDILSKKLDIKDKFGINKKIVFFDNNPLILDLFQPGSGISIGISNSQYKSYDSSSIFVQDVGFDTYQKTTSIQEVGIELYDANIGMHTQLFVSKEKDLYKIIGIPFPSLKPEYHRKLINYENGSDLSSYYGFEDSKLEKPKYENLVKIIENLNQIKEYNPNKVLTNKELIINNLN